MTRIIRPQFFKKRGLAGKLAPAVSLVDDARGSMALLSPACAKHYTFTPLAAGAQKKEGSCSPGQEPSKLAVRNTVEVSRRPTAVTDVSGRHRQELYLRLAGAGQTGQGHGTARCPTTHDR